MTVFYKIYLLQRFKTIYGGFKAGLLKTQGSARFEAMATPLFQYKNFVFMWGGSYGKEHRCAYLLTPYLASINNLSSAVVKNTDKTMKITYTLTEETM